jgi:hypothetical protein
VYRTDPNGTDLKLHITIFDNTQTSIVDANPNAVGAAPPTVNTSGFVEQVGTIDVGATSLPATFAERFPSGGGWAAIGNLLIRYTSISNNTLSGIPASGVGAVSVPIRYGDAIDPVPALTGVTGLTSALSVNAPVNIWIQKDDLTAQAALGQKVRDEANNPTDGIHEHTLTDQRIRSDTAEKWAETDLSMFAREIVSLEYHTMDIKTRAGKIVRDALTETVYELKIQEVDISEVDIAPGKWPRFSVRASSIKFTFEDLIRRARLL